uniref:Biogenesis of lysosome-related organelles complex 1 subunit 7 n=1 Tax=Manihot esculenta TaxID=3983 RepID=A0A2C9VRR6_MANES
MESPKDRRNCNPNFDSKAQVALKSQDHLNCIIDRHTRELDQLLEDAPLPFVMQHTAKVSGVRTRVSSLNSLLKSIQRRIDNIDPILSVGSTQALFKLQWFCKFEVNFDYLSYVQ